VLHALTLNALGQKHKSRCFGEMPGSFHYFGIDAGFMLPYHKISLLKVSANRNQFSLTRVACKIGSARQR
jgi:hypothetical protein